MLISKTVGRFIARLLIGVLVYAQVAVAAYACPPADTMSAPWRAVAVDTRHVADSAVGVMPTDSWRMDAAQPALCAGHCQSSQQNVDVKPAPTPPVALLAGYFTLKPVAQGAGHNRPFEPAPGPPPLADPPHAILHCCLRV